MTTLSHAGGNSEGPEQLPTKVSGKRHRARNTRAHLYGGTDKRLGSAGKHEPENKSHLRRHPGRRPGQRTKAETSIKQAMGIREITRSPMSTVPPRPAQRIPNHKGPHHTPGTPQSNGRTSPAVGLRDCASGDQQRQRLTPQMGLRRRAVGRKVRYGWMIPARGQRRHPSRKQDPASGSKQMTGRAVERAAKRRVPQEKTARTEGPKGSQPKPADKDIVAQVPADRKGPVPQMGRRAGWQTEDGIENGETRRDSGKRRKCPSPKQDLPCGTREGTLRKGTSGHTEYKTTPRRKRE